jgi:hypothetical protein
MTSSGEPESRSEDAQFALYAADAVFLAGIVMGPLFLSAGQWADALVTFGAAAIGAAFSFYQGQPWPGWAVLRYWRRYL